MIAQLSTSQLIPIPCKDRYDSSLAQFMWLLIFVLPDLQLDTLINYFAVFNGFFPIHSSTILKFLTVS